MKVNTNELYGEKYCKRIDDKEWRFATIPNVVKVLYDHFKPESVVDVGCANGLHLRAFRDIGVGRLLGVEGTKHWAKYIERYFGPNYMILDLRESFNEEVISIMGVDIEPFDLVLCFEVLEHLEKVYADQAVENLCALGDTICCSACPISGGFHHFNPQPKEYWIEKFKRQNYRYCKDEVDLLQSQFKQMRCSGWFKTGLKVFRKVN